ncbi:hypothetical protein CEP52_017619, partial [Fusarium oligoseptatum]
PKPSVAVPLKSDCSAGVSGGRWEGEHRTLSINSPGGTQAQTSPWEQGHIRGHEQQRQRDVTHAFAEEVHRGDA